MTFLSRIKQSSRELILFATAALALGMAFSMVDSTFNNFLNEKFALSGFQRSFLEFPRELPGFLLIFITGLRTAWLSGGLRLGGVVVSLLAPTGCGGDDPGRCRGGDDRVRLHQLRGDDHLAFHLQHGQPPLHASRIHHRHGTGA